MEPSLNNREWIEATYAAGASQQRIAEILDVNINRVRRAMGDFGIKPDKARMGRYARTPDHLTKMAKSVSLARASETPEQRAAHALNISRGKFKHGVAQGRQRVYVEGRGVTHRYIVVAEAMLGRSLVKGEIVHHKDGNPLNDDWRNLEVMTLAEHARLHALERSRNEFGQFL